MRAAEPLVIVGCVQGVLIIQDRRDLAEDHILVETASERAGRRLHLSGNSRIIGEEISRKADQSRGVVNGDRLVTDLAFIIREVKNPVVVDGTSDGGAELLPAISRLGNSFSVID